MYWIQSLPVFSESTMMASMFLPSTFVTAIWYFFWVGWHRSIRRPYWGKKGSVGLLKVTLWSGSDHYTLCSRSLTTEPGYSLLMLSIISALRCWRLFSCRSILASPSCSITYTTKVNGNAGCAFDGEEQREQQEFVWKCQVITWLSSVLISSILLLAISTSSVSSSSMRFCSSRDCL